MSGFVLAVVLCGALLHATWNALIRSGTDSFLSTVLVAAGAALLSAAALPFVAQPAPASWPFIGASAATQLLYYILLAETYRAGDMSHSYPLMRGSAPLLVALASAGVLHQPLRLGQWLAIACISGGILTMWAGTRRQGAPARRTTTLALATACSIAAFTLIDGAGVRRAGAPAAYTMWIFLLTGAAYLAWCRHRRRGQLLAYARRHARIGVVGGAGTLGSYGLALWAMTQAPVATVAALRETSILFATAIAALVLHERISAQRYLAVALVGCGALAIRLV